VHTSTPARCSRSTSRSGCTNPHRLRTYLIADNLSTHKTPDIRRWADNNNIELVFTPTYTSFLNRIECHFWGIGEFVINNADYLSLNQRLIAAERKLLIAA
jgi:transposase